jgi:hypothetical protein
MGTFELDINKFIKKCGDNADQVVRKTMTDITTSLVERSPVGDPSKWKGWNEGGVAANKEHWLVKSGFVQEGYAGGHFRANWQLGIGSLPSGEIDARDKTGAATKAKLHGEIPEKAAGKIYFVANNLPYAQALEDGHSGQAPEGMVALTEVEFQSMINKAVAELK